MGTGGEVRGKTKIQTYIKYKERCESWPGSHAPDPDGKKYCYKCMEWDDRREEWVLPYFWHK